MDSSEQKVSKGLFLTKKAVIILIAVAICVYAATVLGLVFGLKDASSGKSHHHHHHHDHDPSETNATTTFEPAVPKQKVNYRLPNSTRPFYYDIRIEMKSDVFTKPTEFDGDVRLDINCEQATDQIVMHMKNLTIFNDSIRIVGISDPDFEIKNATWSFDKEKSFMIVNLTKNLIDNHKYSLYIKYRGAVNSGSPGFASGLYRKFYTDNYNRTR
jgi:hypothetical protein